MSSAIKTVCVFGVLGIIVTSSWKSSVGIDKKSFSYLLLFSNSEDAASCFNFLTNGNIIVKVVPSSTLLFTSILP